MTKSPQAGRTGKSLALLATFTMLLAALVGLAPSASAAPPDQCPSGYTFSAGTCEKTLTAAPVPGDPAYACPSEGGWTLDGDTCTRPVEPIQVCDEEDDDQGELSIQIFRERSQCDDDEWHWVCEIVVSDDDNTDDEVDLKSAFSKRGAGWHFEEKECGGPNDQKPECDDQEIPATPVLVCPAGYTSPDKPVSQGSTCTQVVTTTPTCPAGQNLVNGDCQTPSTPPVVPENPPADPQPQAIQPVVAAAVTEPPAEAPAQIAAAPAAATVAKPAKRPATATVPQAATVPAAVPAGDGSSQQFPLVAVAVAMLMAMAAAGAGLRLKGSRR